MILLPQDNVMDIKVIIEELEKELSESKNFLFNKKKALVNMDKCGALIEELKHSMPAAIQEANYILGQKDKIIAQAKEQAERTLREAEIRVEQLLSESALVKKAEIEAEEILELATKKSNQLMAAVKSNVDKMLKSVEDYLIENINIVRNNREELNGNLIMMPNKKSNLDDKY